MEYTQTISGPEVTLLVLGEDLDDKIDEFCVFLKKGTNIGSSWDQLTTKPKKETRDKTFWENNLKLYMHSIPELEFLSLEKELELGKKTQTSKKAEEELIQYYLPLVISIAKQYNPEKLDLLDLIQVGNIAVLRCIRKYNLELNIKLYFYAKEAINNAIIHEIKQSNRTIRMPNWMCEYVNKRIKAEKKFIYESFRKPTLSELAYEMGIPEKRLKKLEGRNVNCDSLDRKVRFGKDIVSKYSFVKDKRISTEDAAIKLNLKSEIDQLLSKNLSERYADVIKMRFGLEDGVPRTLDEIKAVYGISRERARQIVSAALDKLKQAPFVDGFLVYYN